MKSYRDSLPNFAKPLVKLALILALLLVLPVAQVFAETIYVDADCELTEAIQNANNNAATNSDCEAGVGDDIITITRAGTTNGTITVTSQLTFARESKLTINGGGFTISGGGSTRIFNITVSSTTLTLNNMTIADGSAIEGSGIYSSGTLTINNSTIRNNDAGNRGGGIYIDSGTLTINNSTVRDNDAGNTGGGIYINSGTHTINNSTIRDNSTTSGNGGGIFIISGSLTINNSTIADNDAEIDGGGIFSHAINNLANELTINNSRFAGNTAVKGGAIYAGSTEQLTMINSTIADNKAHDRIGLGGGIYAFSPFELTHVTMVNNTAGNGGGGLYITANNDDTHNKIIRNSILANNGDSDCKAGGNRRPTENVGNLIMSGDCGGDALTADPRLGSLTGRPAYYPLLAGSPAIDAAVAEHCTDKDQRGTSRPYGAACDIGAYEWTPVEEECVGCPPPKGPFVRTTIALLPEIEVSDLTGFTEAQRIDAGGVGIQSVIDRGIVDAVDVWGFMGAGTRVCFLASGGSFSFLNAANSPRTVSSLPLYVIEGKTCTFIDGPGSIVLHPGAAPASNGPAWALSNCMVTTTDVLNFRAGPGGEVIGGVPYNATLTALSRTAGWFEVDYHGVTGWISAQYVTPNGECG